MRFIKGELPGNRTRNSFKGEIFSLFTDAAESKTAKAVMKDGKFKTNASALNKLIDELKLSDMLQGKMVTQLKNNLPFKVVTLTTGNGLQRKILVKNPDYQFTSKKIGEGGGKTILVDEDIHREFRHIGGQSTVNGKIKKENNYGKYGSGKRENNYK